MPCYTLKINGEKSGFICGELGPHCSSCGAPADNLCDYPVGNDKTCDRELCDSCSTLIGIDIHYCIGHLKLWNDFRANNKDVKYLDENVRPFK